MTKEKIYRIIELILTALVAVAGAVLLDSCASTTTVVTRSKTGSGAVTSTVTVRTDAEQQVDIAVKDTSLTLKNKDTMAFNRIPPKRVTEIILPDPVGQPSGQPSVLSSLLSDDDIDETGAVASRLRTDNYLILHQKDLENRIGPDNLRAFVDALNRNSGSSLHDQRQAALDKLSDRELFGYVRSRHIQAPADVAAYAEDLLNQAAGLADRRDRLLRENAVLADSRLSRERSDVSPADSPSVSE